MTEYIRLGLSMKETAISIRREGQRIWRGKNQNAGFSTLVVVAGGMLKLLVDTYTDGRLVNTSI